MEPNRRDSRADVAEHLDLVLLTADRNDAPFLMPWPEPGNPSAILSFERFVDWQIFVSALSLHPAIPEIVGNKFRRAQQLYLLAWIDFGLVKAGELVALTALELTLKERYGLFFLQQRPQANGKPKRDEHPPNFNALLEHLVEKDGLTDAVLPFAKRYGGSITPMLYTAGNSSKGSNHVKAPRPTLPHIRNSLAHGDPFDGLPWSGLLELVKDLIEYAYRSYLQEISHVGNETC